MSEEAIPGTPRKRGTQARRVSGASSSANADQPHITPSPTPSLKTKIALDRVVIFHFLLNSSSLVMLIRTLQSGSKKKAFYPGMAGLGRLRSQKDSVRTVSSRAADQNTWQGLISFNDTISGQATSFSTRVATVSGVQPIQGPPPVERKDHYLNTD
jgi:hypothetical protein